MARSRRGFATRRYGNSPSNVRPTAALPEPGAQRKRGRPKKVEPMPIARLPEVPRPAPGAVPSWTVVSTIPAPPGVATTPYGSQISRRLSLKYVMTHPVGFRRYMIPKITPRGYWHRYFMTPVVLAAPQGDMLLRAGRGLGKSFAALEPELVQFALTHPGEESMLTAFRKLHIVDRMERVIDYLETPELRRYVKSIKRQPTYIIQLHNGHLLYGINIGDDPEAKGAQGKHVSLLVGEEFHLYPMRAWLKIQGAQDPRGCRVMLFGVPDGRVDSPFRLADSQYASFVGRRFQLSRVNDPYWDQATKLKQAQNLGGLTSEAYKQEVHAEWGSPAWSAWDIASLYRCMTLPGTPVIIRVDGQVYRDQHWTDLEALIDLPPLPAGAEDCLVVADVGYTEPTSAGVLWLRDGVWRLHARIELVNRMEHDVQATLLWAICQRMRASGAGIDATEGEGRAIATELDTLADRTGFATRIAFTETIATGLVEQVDPLTGEITEVEQFEPAKALGTRLLRAQFAGQQIQMALDEQMINEFNREMEHKTPAGMLQVRTPGNVHIPEMFRVFALTLFLRPPETTPASDFELPQWGYDPLLALREDY